MLTATFLAIFYVPLFFVFVTKLFTVHKNKVVLPTTYTGKTEN